jgi:hypothetical protein
MDDTQLDGMDDAQNSDDSEEEDDAGMTSDDYIKTLKRLQNHSSRVRAHDVEREETMRSTLPMNDRLLMSREKKVLTLWQERQRDWQQVEQKITRRIKAGEKHTLMMLASDEYRARIEEYDLLQAAVRVLFYYCSAFFLLL